MLYIDLVSRTAGRGVCGHLTTQNEVLEVPQPQRLPRKRMIGTLHAASATIARLIFDSPTRRSRKTIGTSVTVKPACSARNVVSIWKAYPSALTVSIRLATEFHILLAHMTNSPILVRYVSEVAYRCCLTLSLYSRPHSSECAINEHRAIIAALVKGDEAKVMGLMHSHLDSVANRALVAPAPQRGRDLLDILAPYAEEGDGGRVVKLPKVVRAR